MTRGTRTVEKAVCDQPAWVQDLVRVAAAIDKRVAVVQRAAAHDLPLQLVVVTALHVAPVVLVEVLQLVVDIDRRVHVLCDVHAHKARPLGAGVAQHAGRVALIRGTFAIIL